MTNKTRWQAYKEKLGETRPWDMLDPNVPRVSEEVRSTRFSVCQGCDRLMHLTHQCKECGCFMNLKTALEKATCPLGKW